MDRERKDELPQMQVEFIDQICVPLYTSLSDRLDKNIFFFADFTDILVNFLTLNRIIFLSYSVEF